MIYMFLVTIIFESLPVICLWFVCSCGIVYNFGFLGKVHGSLARAGKVRAQTPKVEKQEKKKKKTGRI